MRVGVKVEDIPPECGGAATFVRSIQGALETASTLYEIVYLKNIRGKMQSRALIHRVGRRCNRIARRLINTPPQPSAEEREILEAEVDIVWYMAPLARPAPVPYLATVWDLEHRRMPMFPEVGGNGWAWQTREDNYRRLLPRACRVLTGTHAGKNDIVRFYGVAPENISVIPLPVDARFRTPAAAAENIRAKYGITERFIFYPAQFWPHKNHVNLLLALRRYNDDHPKPLHLVLTGSNMGNQDHVMSTIRELDIPGIVHVLGFLPHEDMLAIYAQSEAMIFPTFFGPDNLPPLEAFALGCPVAASRVPGAEEQFGDAAILFNPASPAEIADAMARIVDDPAKRSDLIDRGRKRVASLTPENYVAKVFDVLAEIEPLLRCWGKSHVRI